MHEDHYRHLFVLLIQAEHMPIRRTQCRHFAVRRILDGPVQHGAPLNQRRHGVVHVRHVEAYEGAIPYCGVRLSVCCVEWKRVERFVRG